MKIFETNHNFNHPWSTITLANWNKYPNPISNHVISCDVLSRTVDSENGTITTERLLSCKQPVPAILKYLGLGIQEEAYFHEISTLNLKTKEYKAESINLTMRGILAVQETCVLTVNPDAPDKTLFKQEAQFNAMGALAAVGKVVEDMAVNRFSLNAEKGRDALESVASRLWNEAREFELKMLSGLEELGLRR